jgi:hypothetical protein
MTPYWNLFRGKERVKIGFELLPTIGTKGICKGLLEK